LQQGFYNLPTVVFSLFIRIRSNVSRIAFCHSTRIFFVDNGDFIFAIYPRPKASDAEIPAAFNWKQLQPTVEEDNEAIN
jgi:hypothetical protein